MDPAALLIAHVVLRHGLPRPSRRLARVLLVSGPGLQPPADSCFQRDNCMSIHAALSHVTLQGTTDRSTWGRKLVRLRPAPHCRNNVVSL